MDRSSRERLAYDSDGVKRSQYTQRFPRSSRSTRFLDELIMKYMQECEGKNVLEIGSNGWIAYIYNKNIKPKRLTCINISLSELNAGESFYHSENVNFPIDFILMDANKLLFEDRRFDFVFGGAILHHLDISTAVSEISRVSKNSGAMLFHEPLGLNPFSALIRSLTPSARTLDEKPLFPKDINKIKRYFELNLHFSEFMCVIPNIVLNFILG